LGESCLKLILALLHNESKLRLDPNIFPDSTKICPSGNNSSIADCFGSHIWVEPFLLIWIPKPEILSNLKYFDEGLRISTSIEDARLILYSIDALDLLAMILGSLN